MANGPMTEQQAAQSQWSFIWHSLPEEVKAGLTKLEAEHPGEVLSAVSGGVITAVPEGQELDSWMRVLAAAGGAGPVDQTALYFSIDTYWADPPHPEENKGCSVGVQARANQTIQDYVELSVTVRSRMTEEILQIKSEMVRALGEEQIQASIDLDALPRGSYIVEGYLNNAGVDPGNQPGPAGYRTPFQFTLPVGEYDDDRGGELDRVQQLSTLAQQFTSVQGNAELVELVQAIVAELTGVEALSKMRAQLMNFPDEVRRLRDLNPSASLGALDAVVTLAHQIGNLRGEPDAATIGVLEAQVEQFMARVEAMATVD